MAKTRAPRSTTLLLFVLVAAMAITLVPARPAQANPCLCSGTVVLGFASSWYVTGNVCVNDRAVYDSVWVEGYARLRCHRTSDGTVVHACRFDIRHLKLIGDGYLLSEDRARTLSRAEGGALDWYADWTGRTTNAVLCATDVDYQTKAQTIYVRTIDGNLTALKNLNSAIGRKDCRA
jgi:hypothetical protein